MASSLAPEIWFTILNHIPRSGQLCMSQVSPQLCAVARKIIYCNVKLRSNNVAVEATLALLTRDYSVAQNIKKLEIYTAADKAQDPIWFDPDVLVGMTNLYELELTGMPFHTKEDQLKFNTVSESLPTLKKLKYFSLQSEGSKIHSSDPEIHVPVLQISGLQQITWLDPGAYLAPIS